MDEILVHVSAPSAASDDARYRVQVAAIRDYLLTTNDQHGPPSERQVSATESASTQGAENPAENPAEDPHPAENNPAETPRDQLPSQQSSPLVRHSRDQPGPDSQLHALEISNNNDPGNDDHPVHDPQADPTILALPLPLPGPGSGPSAETKSIGTVLLAPTDRPPQDYGSGHDSLGSLISVIPDSQPEPELQLEPEPEPEPKPDLISPSVQAGSALFLALQTDRKSSPPRYRHEDSPLHSPSPKRRRTGNGPSTSSSTIPSAHEATTSSLPSPAAQGKTTSQKAKSKPITTTSTSTTTTSPANPESPLTTLLKNTPLQIRPPPPPISKARFTTHKTPTLSLLEQRLNPSRTYKPVRQTRALDNLERGYWAVQIGIGAVSSEQEQEPGPELDRHRQRSETGTWTPAFFARFWGFLAEFIGKEGRAGWGVWCFLDRVEGAWSSTASGGTTTAAEQVHTQAQSQTEDLSRPTSGETVSVLLKVYAWGEIAMHIYLVLYLASERRIRGLSAQWRDSREVVVIQMS